MRNELFVKSFIATADILKFRIVKPGAADNKIAVAGSGAEALCGVTDSLGGKADKTVDIIMGGLASVTYGGTVTRGAPLTSDTVGRAVVATVSGQRLIGFAAVSGVAGDTGSVNIQLGFFA